MAPDPSGDLLAALLAPDPAAERRIIEFFAAHIRNRAPAKPTPGLQPASPPARSGTASPIGAT